MYTATVLENVDNGQGRWNSQLIGILDKNGNTVGSFKRNYHSYGVSTFAPFKIDNQWYALYSESYSEIAVMELPSCKKICSKDCKGVKPQGQEGRPKILDLISQKSPNILHLWV
jgi:hypothetical protein